MARRSRLQCGKAKGSSKGARIAKRIASSALSLALVVGLMPATGAWADLLGSASEGTYAEVPNTASADASVWDGSSVDISWYNTTDAVFHIKSAAQLLGLSYITSPLRGTFEEDIPTDASGNYVLTNVKSNATYSDGSPIYVDLFEGKTVILDCDVDIAGGTSTSSTCDWWKPIADCNVYSEKAGGQGASISGSFNCIAWKGTFDGAGHTISNIYVDGMANSKLSTNYGGYQGLFSAIGVGGIIENVGVTGYLKGRLNGGICSISAGSKSGTKFSATADKWPRIQNCWSSVTNVNNGSGSRMSGGIFGGEDSYRVSVNVINCYSSADMSGGESRGGVVGSANGAVAGCYFRGTTTSGGNTGAVAATVYLKGATVDSTVNAGIGVFTNNYALSGSDGNGNFYRYFDANSKSTSTPTAVTTGFSTAAELKAAADGLGSGYVADTENINNGYPVLFWQAGLSTLDISGATVAPIADQSYTGQIVTPDVTVTLNGETLNYGTDYLVYYENNVNVGTAQAYVYGVGRYEGSLAAANFNITSIDLGDMTVAAVPNQWRYPGDKDSAVTPSIYVTDQNGNSLIEGTDFKVEYSNNDAAGVATATVLPADGSPITGSNSTTFNITDASKSLKGSGTAADPYLISSKYDIQFLAHEVFLLDENYSTASYKVTCDIDAATKTDAEPQVMPIGVSVYLAHTPYELTLNDGTTQAGYTCWYSSFKGSFDGDNHTITLGMDCNAFDSLDLRYFATAEQTSLINPYTGTYMGLFGVVGNTGQAKVDGAQSYDATTTIKNLTVDGSVSSTASQMGVAAVVAYDYYGTLELDNVTNAAAVTTVTAADKLAYGTTNATPVAGVCYEATNATITNCTNLGVINGCGNYVAGILGYAYNSSTLTTTLNIESCFNKAAVTSTGYAAGILCYNTGYCNLGIKNCSNVADITAGNVCGGIHACNYGGAMGVGSTTISGCYNTGAVNGTAKNNGVGGIMGRSGKNDLTIENCYNTGAVTNSGTDGAQEGAGGILGYAYTPNVTNCTTKVDFTNCYNVGKTSCDKNANGLIGTVFVGANAATKNPTFTFSGYYTGSNAYTLYSTGSATITNSAQAVSDDAMKGAEVLAGLGSAFAADTYSINNGYPVLSWQEPEPAAAAEVAGRSASLNEQVEYNVYLKTDDATSVATVTHSGETVATIDLSELTPVEKGEYAGCYKVSFAVNAKNMGDEYTLTLATAAGQNIPLVNSEGAALEDGYTSSVVSYLEELAETSSDETVVNTAKATMAYASASQVYFNAGTPVAQDLLFTVEEARAALPEAYEASTQGTLPEGVSYKGATLLLEGNTAVRLYFATSDVSSLTFTVDGASVEPQLNKSNNTYYIEAAGIAAADLNATHSFTVADGKTTYTATYCPLAYANSAVNATKSKVGSAEHLNTLGAAIYGYWYWSNKLFKPASTDLADATVTVADGKWNGAHVEPQVTVVLNGQEVPSDAYTVTYSDNVDPSCGVATATVTAVDGGDYTGTNSATFNIKADINDLVKMGGQRVIVADVTQTSDVLSPNVTVRTAKNDGITFEEGADYTVTTDPAVISAAGTYTATITATATGRLTGTYSAQFNVIPYFTVYLQKGSDITTVTTLTKSEFEALESSGDPVSGVYDKNDSVMVDTAATYVKVSELLDYCGVGEEYVSSSSVVFNTSDNFPCEATYSQLEHGLWYPNATSIDDLGTGAVEVPAVLSLTEMSSTTTTIASDTEADNVKNADTKCTPRLVWGSVDGYENAFAGKRLVSNVCSITLIMPEE